MTLWYSYQNQDVTVRWDACISDGFKATNGVRQSGILLSQLFNLYIYSLSDILNTPSLDGSIWVSESTIIMLYADSYVFRL